VAAPGSTLNPNDGAAPRVGQPASLPSPETIRLYQADWVVFARWCRAWGFSPLPATPGTLAAFLEAEAANVGRPTLARRKAAIAAMHRVHSLPPPVLDRVALAGVRAACRAGRVASRLGPRPTPALLRRLAAACPGDLAGLRDRALLLLAAATGRGLGAAVPAGLLLGLDAEHVRIEAEGVLLRVRRRADDAQPGCSVRIARDAFLPICPARALEDWLRASDSRFGPVFRKVDRWGNVEHARLGPDGLRRIVKRRLGSGRGAV